MNFEARGHEGQMLFDGHNVTITRRGFFPFLIHGAGGTKTIPLRSITAVQHRRCGLFHGYLQLSVAGELEHTTVRGRQTLSADENAVVFYFLANSDFQKMADTLRAAIRDLQNGVMSAEIPDHSNERRVLFSQIEELGEMRDKGYVTEDEFQAKKTQLLASL